MVYLKKCDCCNRSCYPNQIKESENGSLLCDMCIKELGFDSLVFTEPVALVDFPEGLK